MATKGENQKQLTESMAALCLILNVVVLPGLGSLIAGRTTEGTLQLVLFLVGIPLSFVIVGIPLMIAMWIWSLISGIDIMSKRR
jgi:TM2 domain-containing membrane protein YozV